MVEINCIGKYVTGRSYQWLSNGVRRWINTKGFEVVKLSTIDISISYIEVCPDAIEKHDIKPKTQTKYLITLMLTQERIKELNLNKHNTLITHLNPIKKDEFVKICIIN